MREILFRGKSELLGWVYGWYCPEVKWGEHHFPVGITQKTKEGWLDDAVVIPETIGQFTGLTDKNGKKIFEGDIIKIPDDYEEFGINAGEIYEVYFAFGGFRLKPKYSQAKGFWLEDDETVEIIGNIHDNPELLENP